MATQVIRTGLDDPIEGKFKLVLESLDFCESFEGPNHSFYFPAERRPKFDFTGVVENENGVQIVERIVRVPVIDEVVMISLQAMRKPRTNQMSMIIREPEKAYRLPVPFSGELVDMWPKGCKTSVSFSR